MFSGIGGFEKGIEQAYDICNQQTATIEQVGQGGDRNASQGRIDVYDRSDSPLCIGYSEIDKYAIKVYERHFNHENYGSATDIVAADLPDFDLLVGGFPCQAFSIAGKRAGFDDTRGTLFFDIARILKDKRPGHLVLENVKGLLSHDGGKTLHAILKVLSDLGYRIEFQVLNSKNFGVPQNRERIYIVGHLRGECSGQVFPIFQNDNPLTRKGGFQSSDAVVSGSLTSSDHKQHSDGNYINVVGTLDDETWSKRNESSRRVYGTDGIAPTIPTGTGTGGGIMPKIATEELVAMRWQRTEKGKQARQQSQAQGKDYTPFSDGHRELIPVKDKPVGALTSQAIAKDSLIGNETRIRRLTPKECERLQGFPDDWTALGYTPHREYIVKRPIDNYQESDHLEKISDTQRYKMCGNAVTVNVVQAVMERLMPCLI